MERIRFAYPGGKARLAPALVEMMPAGGRIYCEPFVGRGNVFFQAAQLLKFDRWIINDIQHGGFFRILKEGGNRILAPHTSQERAITYDLGKEHQGKHVLDWKDTDVFVEVLADKIRNKKLPPEGLFLRLDKVPIKPNRQHQSHYAHMKALEPCVTYNGGGYKNGPDVQVGHKSGKGMEQTLAAAWRVLNQVNVEITDFDWKHLAARLSEMGFGPNDFVFADPPYFGCHPKAYDCASFDHPGFVKWLKKAPFRWMLTEYRQDFYVKAFGEPRWTKEVHVAMAGKKRWRAVECVWTNY